MTFGIGVFAKSMQQSAKQTVYRFNSVWTTDVQPMLLGSIGFSLETILCALFTCADMTEQRDVSTKMDYLFIKIRKIRRIRVMANKQVVCSARAFQLRRNYLGSK